MEIVWQYDPDRPGSPPPATPAEAAAALVRGNRLFGDVGKDGNVRYVIPVSAQEMGLRGDRPQTPIAAVLGCADARVPLELVFSQPANDLFVVRVAGNVLGDPCVGSFDFAVQQLPSMRALVVVGHSGCGAVAAAVDAYLTPAHYLALTDNLPLRGIIDAVLPCVRGADTALRAHHGDAVAEHPAFRAALLDVAVVVNAAVTAEAMTRIFRDRLGERLGVFFGVYQLASRLVGMPGDGWQPGLFAPPGREVMPQFVLDVVRSPHVAAQLQ